MDLREGGYSDPQRVWGQLPSSSHVSRLLKALRQSLQKPQEVSLVHWDALPSQ
jgi:hypothetical protein